MKRTQNSRQLLRNLPHGRGFRCLCEPLASPGIPLLNPLIIFTKICSLRHPPLKDIIQRIWRRWFVLAKGFRECQIPTLVVVTFYETTRERIWEGSGSYIICLPFPLCPTYDFEHDYKVLRTWKWHQRASTLYKMISCDRLQVDRYWHAELLRHIEIPSRLPLASALLGFWANDIKHLSQHTCRVSSSYCDSALLGVWANDIKHLSYFLTPYFQSPSSVCYCKRRI